MLKWRKNVNVSKSELIFKSDTTNNTTLKKGSLYEFHLIILGNWIRLDVEDTCAVGLNGSQKLTKCRDDLKNYWKDESEEFKHVCCFAWGYAECLYNEAKDKCNEHDQKIINDAIDSVDKSEKQCDNYQRGSPECVKPFPWWGIVLIVIGSILILGIIAFLVFKFIRKR
jgi:hypothetical protein